MVDWTQVSKGFLLYKASTEDDFWYEAMYNDALLMLRERMVKSPEEAAMIVEGIQLQMSFRHPKICSVLGYKVEENAKIAILGELVNRRLSDQVDSEKSTNTFRDDETLLYHFRSLIGTFADLQRAGICHRNVCPRTICVKNQGLCLTDFEYGKKTFDCTASVVGVPYFFSPEMKETYRDLITGGKENQKLFSPYKSDVYSLGLTFLYMCMLELSKVLGDLKDLEANTRNEIARLNRGDQIKQLITMMLIVSPSERPDFVTLEQLCKSESEKRLEQLNSGSNESSEALSFLLVNQQRVLNIQCKMTRQCLMCSQVYEVNLLIDYPAENLSFCCDQCYTSYHQAIVYKPTLHTCMKCMEKFRPNTDWHSAVKPDQALLQMDLFQLCSLQCHQSIIQEELEKGNARPHVPRKASVQGARVEKRRSAPPNKRPEIQSASPLGDTELKRPKQKLAETDVFPRQQKPVASNLLTQIPARRNLVICNQCKDRKQCYLECYGMVVVGKMLKTHLFCETCVMNSPEFDGTNCPFCAKINSTTSVKCTKCHGFATIGSRCSGSRQSDKFGTHPFCRPCTKLKYQLRCKLCNTSEQDST